MSEVQEGCGKEDEQVSRRRFDRGAPICKESKYLEQTLISKIKNVWRDSFALSLKIYYKYIKIDICWDVGGEDEVKCSSLNAY